MSADTLEHKIAKLRQEIEKLSAKHAERLAQGAAIRNSKWREMETKRTQILARRTRQLDAMLDALQKSRPEPREATSPEKTLAH